MPAIASQPTGKAYGPWYVSSISSLSGTEGNDASVTLAQGEEPNTLRVNWTTGGPVIISMNIEKCRGEDDFEASYSVEIARWQRLSRRDAQQRLRADFTAWLDQAKLSCGSAKAAATLNLAALNSASADFIDRLKSMANEDQARRAPSLSQTSTSMSVLARGLPMAAHLEK